ncbi:MAG: efflux RND transporter periplasmic adaptor subunit [Bacteroidota bacterium]
MKKIVITAIVSILLGIGAGWFIFHPALRQEGSNNRKIIYYRDPMNPKITSLSPKKASDGMDFVPVYAETSEQSGQKKIAYYKDPMHPWYTSSKPGKAPDCGMDLVPVYEGDNEGSVIKIDPVTIQNIGVTTEPAELRNLSKKIRATGKIDYDETKLYSITSKVMGYVERLYIDYTGQAVHKGEALMEIYSPELVETQQEYLQAIQYQKKMANSTMEEARKEAEQLVQSSKRRLLNWDIPESEIKALKDRGTPKRAMTIASPVNGVVTDKMVTQGQNVMSGMTLYKIADLSSVWILADVYQYELPWVSIGQKADIELSYLPGKKISGTVTYINPYLSMDTKTATVRITVRNPSDNELKPEMFATVNLLSPAETKDVTIPDQAIIRSGERNVVVIALGNGYFTPRNVKLGLEADGYTEVLEGVKAGENIVTSSQFLIDSESNLKAAVSSMLAHSENDTAKSIMQSGPLGKNKNNTPEHKTSKKDKGHNRPGVRQMEHKKVDSPKKLSYEVASGELVQNANGTSVQVDRLVDPVCGMEADQTISITYDGKKYYFCSSDDKKKFQRALKNTFFPALANLTPPINLE